ncbi:MAG: hypothetical protein U5N55_05325 [Cypionkella sp.]|nr:hypothetical protein [Cypionkella sp.]
MLCKRRATASKAMLPASVRATGADILLGNTYHLMLRPTAERIAAASGGICTVLVNGIDAILTDQSGFR